MPEPERYSLGEVILTLVLGIIAFVAIAGLEAFGMLSGESIKAAFAALENTF